MKTSPHKSGKNSKKRYTRQANNDKVHFSHLGPKIAIFDYGAGNLFSLKAALERNGAGNVSIIRDMKSLHKFNGLILPGVGNFDPAIISIREDKEMLVDAIKNRMPVLGICLGMEMLFSSSQEGTLEGLKLIDGQVLMLDKKKVKVPHMGWNSIQLVAHKRGLPKKTSVAENESENVGGSGRRGSRLLHNVEDNSWVYFVHSYRILPVKPERKIVVANSQYGDNMIPAVIEKGSIFGTQFHPEKSGPVGSQIMKNFLKICSSPVMAEVT